MICHGICVCPVSVNEVLRFMRPPTIGTKEHTDVNEEIHDGCMGGGSFYYREVGLSRPKVV